MQTFRSLASLRNIVPGLVAALWLLGTPHALAAQWVRQPGPGGGEVRAITVSPRPGTALCGAGGWGYAQGSFRSTDGGGHWIQNTRPPEDFQGLDFAFHPTDPDVFHQVELESMFRTEDGGITWERYSFLEGYHCCYVQIEFDPAHAGRVYAIADLGLFPLLYRSDDDGRSWKRTAFQVPCCEPYQLLVQPCSGTILVSGHAGVARSTDGGASSEQVIESNVSRMALCHDRPEWIWAVGQSSLWLSTDDGATWQPRPHPQDLGQDSAIAVHPREPQQVVLTSYLGRAWRTGNGGEHWERVEGIPHFLQVRALASAPWDPPVFFAGTPHGVWTSTDGGATWAESSTGLHAVVTNIQFDHPPGTRIWAANVVWNMSWEGTDWLSSSLDGGATWGSHDPRTHYMAGLATVPGRPEEIYLGRGLTTTGEMFHSADGGQSWKLMPVPMNGHVDLITIDRWGNLFLASRWSSSITRTLNGGQTWQTVDDPPRYILVLVADLERRGVLHLMSKLGYWRSEDSGASWQKHTQGYGLTLVDMAIDPFDTERIYVIDSLGELQFSPNGGDDWLPGGSLESWNPTRLAMDPRRHERLIVGTEQNGAWMSKDSGLTFQPFSEGLDDLHVLDVEFDPRVPGSVWLSTQNGGLWRRQL